MKKRIVSLLILIVLLITFSISVSAEAWEGFTYDYFEDAVPSKVGYSTEKVFNAEDISAELGSFNEPKDIFVSDDNEVYVLDTGNRRVVVLNSEFELIKVISEFKSKDGSVEILDASGIFVTQDKKIYIADSTGNCVWISDINGNIEKKLEKPDTEMLDDSLELRPRKVLVDSAGVIYVAAAGVYQGALLYTPDGEFDGFYGSNTVELSGKLLLDRFWKSIMTNEQADNIAQYYPEEFTSFDIDDRDFIFTVTQTTSTKKKIKKLNPMGRDTLEAENFGELESVPVKGQLTDSLFVDIVVSKSGVFSALDQRSNRIFQYDEEGNLLFIIGGSGSQSGTFVTPSAIESLDDKLIVLDSKKNNITVFAPNTFGNMVLEAVSFYNEGKYEEARLLWDEVLKHDHNYMTAYVSIGKALLADEKFKEAAEYFKLGNDRDGYSDAFQSYRNELLQKNFIWIFLGIIIVVGLLIWLFGRNKKADKESCNQRFISPFRFLFHPTDSAEEMKLHKSGSFIISTVILAVWYIAAVLKYAATGFLFNTNDVDKLNLALLFLTTVPVFAVGVVSNWGVCTLMNGKGKMKDIWIGGSYCLIPYIVSNFLYVIFSHYFVLSEQIFLEWILWIGILWSAVMLFGVLSGIHDYSFGATISSAVLTAIGMLIVAFLILLVVSLVQQAFSFVSSIVNELIYRIR